ncbi:MAG: hypothetical protein M5U26_03400 [Planctomycetota bacterium]|nr:hypothetical protein [Planctomycetota bacterium]
MTRDRFARIGRLLPALLCISGACASADKGDLPRLTDAEWLQMIVVLPERKELSRDASDLLIGQAKAPVRAEELKSRLNSWEKLLERVQQAHPPAKREKAKEQFVRGITGLTAALKKILDLADKGGLIAPKDPRLEALQKEWQEALLLVGPVMAGEI